MKNSMTKTLVAAALASALGIASSSAMAAVFPDFIVQEAGATSGAISNSFIADKITGNYVEYFTPTSASTFAVQLYWDAGQFVMNDGTTLVTPTQLNGLGANNYGLYALYSATGTMATVAGKTTFTFSAGGDISLWLDRDQNTDKSGVNGFTPLTLTNTSDDVRLAFGTPKSGTGTLDPSLPTCSGGGGSGINCGSFGSTTSFFLTADGKTFFTTPDPFYDLAFESGQLNNFDPTVSQRINGSLDVVFGKAPEPASLALLGIGLLGLGMGKRARKQA